MRLKQSAWICLRTCSPLPRYEMNKKPIQVKGCGFTVKAKTQKMADNSVDVVSLAFVIHECPETATDALMKEAFRILRPGGTFIMTDNNPQSAVIQKLPPALFTLMKSTEPHSNEYYTINVVNMLKANGFEHAYQEQAGPET